MGAIRLFLAVAVFQSHIHSEILAPNDIAIDNRIVLGMKRLIPLSQVGQYVV
jgi:hypothetical protein